MLLASLTPVTACGQDVNPELGTNREIEGADAGRIAVPNDTASADRQPVTSGRDPAALKPSPGSAEDGISSVDGVGSDGGSRMSPGDGGSALGSDAGVAPTRDEEQMSPVPVAVDPASCSANFLSIWVVRQAEQEPGALQPPDGADAPCYDCMVASGVDCAMEGCASTAACISRHCLCRPNQPAGGQQCLAEDYPSDLCECVEPCFSSPGDACRDQWAQYTSCLVEVCTGACSPH